MPSNPRFKQDKKFLPDLRLTRIFEPEVAPFKIQYITDKGKPILINMEPKPDLIQWLD